jgi:hypothetical protein
VTSVRISTSPGFGDGGVNACSSARPCSGQQTRIPSMSLRSSVQAFGRKQFILPLNA